MKRVSKPLSQVFKLALRPTVFKNFHTLANPLKQENTKPNIISSIDEPKSTSGSVPKNSLNFLDYKNWTTKKTTSVLMAPESVGGAGLSLRMLKPFIKAGFNGVSLQLIVEHIVEKEGDQSYAIKQLQNTFARRSKELSKTCQFIVSWVLRQVMTRQLSFWLLGPVSEQIKRRLREPTGRALLPKEASFLDSFTLYSIAYKTLAVGEDAAVKYFTDVKKMDESLVREIVKWVQRFLQETRALVTPTVPILSNTMYSDELIEDIQLEGTHFTREELHLLESLSQLELNNCNPNLFDRFEFKELRNREETKEQIISIAKSHFKVYNSGLPINKQEIHFINAIGGSGSGKSRILKELANVLVDASKNGSLSHQFENSELIYFNFTNGFKIERGTERDEAYVSMVSARIAYSAFGEPGKYWASKLPKIVNENFFSEVMRIVSQKLHEKHSLNTSETIALVIAFDEFQRATRVMPNLGIDIQHLIGYYCRKYQRRDRLVVLPAFGGTLLASDVPFYPTDYSHLNLKLPCFRDKDTKAILMEQGLSGYYDNRTRIFWYIIGMVPRHLEWAINHFNDLKKDQFETTLSTVYQLTQSQVSSFYGSYWENDIEYLAILTISGFAPKWQQFSKSRELIPVINQLIGSGAIYTHGNGLYLPLLYINSLKNPTILQNGVLDDFIKMSIKPEWEKLVELTLKTLVCKFNMLFYYEKTDQTLFKSIFDGAHYPTDLEKQIVKLTNSTFFTYSTSNSLFDYSLMKKTESLFIKAKCNQEGIDGYGSMIAINRNETLPVIQYSNDSNLTPGNLVKIYSKARKILENEPALIIIVSSATISANTIKMIQEGKITYTEESIEKSMDCPDLVVISGDCFPNFFNTFIGSYVKELNY